MYMGGCHHYLWILELLVRQTQCYIHKYILFFLPFILKENLRYIIAHEGILDLSLSWLISRLNACKHCLLFAAKFKLAFCIHKFSTKNFQHSVMFVLFLFLWYKKKFRLIKTDSGCCFILGLGGGLLYPSVFQCPCVSYMLLLCWLNL